jgi:hypothetical protein
VEACEVLNTETIAELDSGGLAQETPKSRAGTRTVAFPAQLAPEIRWHLERFAEPGERGYVFAGPALPRSEAYRRNLVGRHRGDVQGTDGPARYSKRPRGDDLPACHPEPGPGNRQGSRRPRPRRRRDSTRRTARTRTMGAGDGNRTRMTSLEGCRPMPSGAILTPLTIRHFRHLTLRSRQSPWEKSWEMPLSLWQGLQGGGVRCSTLHPAEACVLQCVAVGEDRVPDGLQPVRLVPGPSRRPSAPSVLTRAIRRKIAILV